MNMGQELNHIPTDSGNPFRKPGCQGVRLQAELLFDPEGILLIFLPVDRAGAVDQYSAIL